jgi:mannuronan synthase
MRATTAGQIAYLNPAAKKGEVVFTINANTGDVLNFQLPCDCEVAVTDGIFEGATVLPFDVILSIFDATLGVRVQTQISIEGLAKVMNGAGATLDVNDGQSIPVRVETTSATTAAALRGDPAVPVRLVPAAGALTPQDIGKAARLRLSSSWFRDLLIPTGKAP